MDMAMIEALVKEQKYRFLVRFLRNPLLPQSGLIHLPEGAEF